MSRKLKLSYLTRNLGASDFLPRTKLREQILEVVSDIRLVGLVISDDFSWTKNTDSIIKRAYAKLWIIRRLKALGASQQTLLDIYYKHIRSILEFGAPAWDGALTKRDKLILERVQRAALKIIFSCK